MKKVLGVGAALVDLIISVDDAWVFSSGSPKGEMTLSSDGRIEELLKNVDAVKSVPGGSACNTIVGLSSLGMPSAFISKVGRDFFGELFQKHLEKNQVDSLLKNSDVPTGRVLSAVTPDAQRTMFSFLGASDTLSIEDFSADIFDELSLTYLEGYRAFDKKTFREIVKKSKGAGVPVALDFGSSSVVNACKPLFEELFSERLIDCIFANEDEAKAYTGKNAEDALEIFSKLSPIAAVKLGRAGALIARGEKRVKVKVREVSAVDTTGAGDLWAAGFLFGLLSGRGLEFSGDLASAVAAEVVQVQGAQIPEEAYCRLKNEFGLNA